MVARYAKPFAPRIAGRHVVREVLVAPERRDGRTPFVLLVEVALGCLKDASRRLLGYSRSIIGLCSAIRKHGACKRESQGTGDELGFEYRDSTLPSESESKPRAMRHARGFSKRYASTILRLSR